MTAEPATGPKSGRVLRAIILLGIAGVAFWGARAASSGQFSSGRKDHVARVSGQPITRSQLDRAVKEKLWLEGADEAVSAERRAKARTEALDELINGILLGQELKKLETPPAVTDAEVSERVKRLEARFTNASEFEGAMKSQGIPDRKSLAERITGQMLREKLIEARISARVKVGDDEARKWFDGNQAHIAQPVRLRARHVFIPTLDFPPEEAKQKLEVALTDLTGRKKDFATIAREISLDPATRDTGGDLGWMTRQRVPADFVTPLFAMEVGKPALLRTKLGWHLVEITEKKNGEARKFEQAKPEIIAALEAVKREEAIRELLASLRKADGVVVEIVEQAP